MVILNESVLIVDWKTPAMLPIVETVVLVSSLKMVTETATPPKTVVMAKMSDGKSFDEHVEDVRSEDIDEDVSEFKLEMKRLEQKEKNGDDLPLYARVSDEQRYAIGISTALIFAFYGVSVNPTEPFIGVVGGVFYWGILVFPIIWLVITKSGTAFRNGVTENVNESGQLQDYVLSQSQQQEIKTGSSQKEKIVCQSCGWKNPKTNKFCHDCGDEL